MYRPALPNRWLQQIPRCINYTLQATFDFIVILPSGKEV